MDEAKIRLNRALFRWCLSNADVHIERREMTLASEWLDITARCGAWWGVFDQIASPELETSLCSVARTLPIPEKSADDQSRPRWLHVATELYPMFGHSALVRHWIENDASVTHSVLVTDQKAVFPKEIRDGAKRSGGTVTILPRDLSLLGRADELRRLAWKDADIVVLHIHQHDIIPSIAFGIEGGPLVLYLNHADHAFWVGSAIADLIVGIRESGRDYCERFRALACRNILPLPLARLSFSRESEKGRTARSDLRSELEIPAEAPMVLTVGNARKFHSLPGQDFFAVAEQVLNRAGDVRWIAVGPTPRGRARALMRKTGGRFKALGNKPDLERYHAAADVYAEGFPMGSLTALLEAGLAGLPCVLAPVTPPPYRSDGIALTTAQAPATNDEYIEAVWKLLRDLTLRGAEGEKLAAQVAEHHVGDGWGVHLDALKRDLPARHRVQNPGQPRQLEAADLRLWAMITGASHRDSLKRIMTAIAERNLEPLAPGKAELWRLSRDAQGGAAKRIMLPLCKFAPALSDRYADRSFSHTLRGMAEAERVKRLRRAGNDAGAIAASLRGMLRHPVQVHPGIAVGTLFSAIRSKIRGPVKPKIEADD